MAPGSARSQTWDTLVPWLYAHSSAWSVCRAPYRTHVVAVKSPVPMASDSANGGCTKSSVPSRSSPLAKRPATEVGEPRRYALLPLPEASGVVGPVAPSGRPSVASVKRAKRTSSRASTVPPSYSRPISPPPSSAMSEYPE